MRDGNTVSPLQSLQNKWNSQDEALGHGTRLVLFLDIQLNWLPLTYLMSLSTFDSLRGEEDKEGKTLASKHIKGLSRASREAGSQGDHLVWIRKEVLLAHNSRRSKRMHRLGRTFSPWPHVDSCPTSKSPSWVKNSKGGLRLHTRVNFLSVIASYLGQRRTMPRCPVKSLSSITQHAYCRPAVIHCRTNHLWLNSFIQEVSRRPAPMLANKHAIGSSR